MASSNAEVQNRLVDAFDRCLTMQADHLTCLKAGCLTKISQCLEERQLVIARLRQTLTGIQTSGLDANLRALLLEKLHCILSTEKTLFTLAEQQRSALLAKITVIRRGKRTLGRYGSSIKNQPPQFINDKR